MTNNFYIIVPLSLLLIFLFVKYVIKFNSLSGYSIDEQLYINGIIVSSLILVNFIISIIISILLYLPIFQMGSLLN